MATHRLFFALWLPETVAASLHCLGEELARQGGGQVMRVDTLHLTLAFLGEVDAARLPELEAVGSEVAAAHRAFRLVLDRIERWDHNRIDWAGASEVPSELGALAASLRASLSVLGFPVEPRAFAPHVTLVRKRAADIRPQPITPLSLLVNELRLVESRRGGAGADYAPVARWPLSAVDSPQRRAMPP